MPWLNLVVDTDAEHAEALSDALLELGALSVDLLDADADTPDEQAIFGVARGQALHLTFTPNRFNLRQSYFHQGSADGEAFTH